MKFVKFLKSCGAFGRVYERRNGDKWLICEGVGMKIPIGVMSLLGVGEGSEKAGEVIEAIIGSDIDDKVILSRASISADGKASDIVRVFSTQLADEVGISNANFGLLEKSDMNLAYLEIEDEESVDRYILVLDLKDEVVGFITGVNSDRY
jgi:hypothetical protein